MCLCVCVLREVEALSVLGLWVLRPGGFGVSGVEGVGAGRMNEALHLRS